MNQKPFRPLRRGIFLLSLLVLSSAFSLQETHGQEVDFGLRLGASGTSFVGGPGTGFSEGRISSFSTSRRLGVIGGGIAHLLFENSLGLRIEANYNQQGAGVEIGEVFDLSNVEGLEGEGTLLVDSNLRFRHHYLSAPILGTYRFQPDEPFEPMIFVGPRISYRVSSGVGGDGTATLVTESGREQSPTRISEASYSGEFEDVDVAGVLGVGGTYTFLNGNKIGFSLRWSRSLTPFNNESVPNGEGASMGEEFSLSNDGLSLSISYIFQTTDRIY